MTDLLYHAIIVLKAQPDLFDVDDFIKDHGLEVKDTHLEMCKDNQIVLNMLKGCTTKAVAKNIINDLKKGITIKSFPSIMNPDSMDHRALLSLATEGSNMDNIRLLKQHGATLINAVVYGGQGTYDCGTPIYIAAEQNNLELLKCVFEGEDKAKWANQSITVQALFEAISHGNREMIDYFLDMGTKLSNKGAKEVNLCWNWEGVNHFKATTDPELLKYLNIKYDTQAALDAHTQECSSLVNCA